jgi:hypothetical protein
LLCPETRVMSDWYLQSLESKDIGNSCSQNRLADLFRELSQEKLDSTELSLKSSDIGLNRVWSQRDWPNRGWSQKTDISRDWSRERLFLAAVGFKIV